MKNTIGDFDALPNFLVVQLVLDVQNMEITFLSSVTFILYYYLFSFLGYVGYARTVHELFRELGDKPKAALIRIRANEIGNFDHSLSDSSLPPFKMIFNNLFAY